MSDKVESLAKRLSRELVAPNLSTLQGRLEALLRAELKTLLDASQKAAHFATDGRPMSNKNCGGCELAAELQGWTARTPDGR